MDKEEILLLQKNRKNLKTETVKLKKKLPIFVMGFIFFISVGFYFLEANFYTFFGDSVNLIIGIVLAVSIILILFLLKTYSTIKSKQKASKALGVKIYNLMKLEVSTDNE